MKSVACLVAMFWMLSHPSRGGWIEMNAVAETDLIHFGPTPHGVGGLKCKLPINSFGSFLVPPLTGWVD